MCVDSQVSAAGFKWPTEKIASKYILRDPIMISGAGYTHGIEVATQKIFRAVADGMDSEECVVSAVEAILRDINENDLAHQLSNSPGDLVFNLIIAFRAKDGRYSLHQSDGSLVKRVEDFCVIGSGLVVNTFAHALYRRSLLGFSSPVMSTSEAQFLAAYLTHLAKRQLDSVGGPTKVAMFGGDGDICHVDDWENPLLEEMFSWHEKTSAALMFSCCDPEYPEYEFSKRIDSFAMAMKDKKAEFRRLGAATVGEIFGTKMREPNTDA